MSASEYNETNKELTYHPFSHPTRLRRAGEPGVRCLKNNGDNRMGLLGGDFWDDIVDPHDRKKKRNDWSPPPKTPKKLPPSEAGKTKISGLTIFYRTFGCFILVATRIKSWLTATTVFDWALMIVALLLIGIHRRLGAEHVAEKIKPAFLDLHNRLKKVEAELNPEKK